jgi:hypothetical protein
MGFPDGSYTNGDARFEQSRIMQLNKELSLSQRL